MRMEKVKSRGELAGRLRHNTREHLAPNVDPDRVQNNLLIGGAVSKVMKDFSARLPENVRKNAVLAVEVMMTASPGFTGDWDKYLKDCDKWVSDFFGKENVLSVAHHLDETTPHTQIMVMPMKDGKLNAKHYIGGVRNRMTELQNDFYEKVGRPAALERGQPRPETRARHTPHTLAAAAADLEAEKRKVEAVAKEVRAQTGMSVTEIRAMKNRIENLERQTPDQLRQWAGLIAAKGCKTVGEYRHVQEEIQAKKQQQKQGHSFSR
jgi:hypothetical protein